MPSEKTDRFEKKFFISRMNASAVDVLIKTHSALFRPLYHERRVNNIYFDTIGLANYEDHVAGAANRWKVRMRWYGETFGEVKDPVLEIKMKYGEVGMKKNFSLPPTFIGDIIDQHALFNLLRQSSVSSYWKSQLQDLRPVLLNSYVRSYWMSADSSVRVTVDKDWTSYFITPSSSLRIASPIVHDGVILEMKYSIQSQDNAASIATKWPWRLTRNSKYVIGMEGFLSR